MCQYFLFDKYLNIVVYNDWVINLLFYSQAEDCSDALEKFKPTVQSNLLNRIHCFWLRGKSLIALGLTEYGEMEIQMAAKLDPINFEQNQYHFMNNN